MLVSNEVGTGSAGRLRIALDETGYDAVLNTSAVHVVADVYSPAGTSGSPMGNWVLRENGTTIAGSTWSTTTAAGYDTLVDTTITVPHDPDGTGSVTFSITIDATGTAGVGGPTASEVTLPLTTLKVVPQQPTGLTAARASDTQINLAWTNHAASNGAATSEVIQQSVNGGALADLVSIAPASSVTVSAAANQKLVHKVRGVNTAGDGPLSAVSNTVYTTPAPPTSVVATKSGSDIVVTFVDHVAFTEHTHALEHGVDVAGVVTWDGSLLATIVAGTLTYTHSAPNPAQKHVYRLSPKNTDVGALTGAAVQSNTVQLLAAPNKPGVSTPAPFQDKAATFRFAWAHNPVDSSAQTKRQVRYSTDGGSTWTTGSKTTDTNQYLDFAGSTWAANAVVTFQVRTKGAYDSGSDGDASYSPYSDSVTVTVTFKTKPVATITAPANASTYTQAALTVVLGFSQAEAATFVSAAIDLYNGATLVESIVSTTLAGTLFATRLANGGTYTVKAIVTDSNGLASSQVTSTFGVTFTAPVAAVVAAVYLPDSGVAQIGLTIPAAGGGLAAATTLTIDRVVDGVSENVITAFLITASTHTILDLTPTIAGDNVYKVTTISAIGATTVVTSTLTTAETSWAFMSKGSDFSQIIRFTGDLKPEATPTVDSALVKTSGRARPIGLYARTGGLVVTGRADLVTGLGSSAKEIEAFLLITGKGCYRDPSGRRVFGQISGKVARGNARLGSLEFAVTETS